MSILKKIFFLSLMFFLCAVKAQSSVDSWVIHPVFNDNATSVIETDDKVYYLVDGYLFSYNKNYEENETYTKCDVLSDINISSIYYNYDKNYLFIAYDNSNINLLKDDGSVIRIPDLHESSLNVDKTIHDVAFSKKGLIYVATGFGYIVIDDAKNEVKKTVNIGTPIMSIGVVGSHVVFIADNKMYSGNINKDYFSLQDFKAGPFDDNGKIVTIDDENFFFSTGWLYKLRFSDDDLSVVSLVSEKGANDLQKTKSGFLFYDNNNDLKKLDNTGSIVSSVALPAELKKSLLASYNSNDDIWQLNGAGLRNIRLDPDLTVLSDYFRPNASNVKISYNLVYNKQLNKLFVTNTGTNYFFDPYDLLAQIGSYDGSNWKDETPSEAPTKYSGHNNGKLNDPYSLVFDPEDGNTYYVGAWHEGAYKVTDGKVVVKYDWDNSPLKTYLNGFLCNVPALAFDKDNNLWMVEGGNSDTPFLVLPRAKQNLTTLTANDWITPRITGITPSKKSKFMITSQNIKLYSEGEYQTSLVIFSDNGVPSSTITSRSFTKLTDQDGGEYNWDYIFCFAEDKNGKVWMGTSNGVVELIPKNALTNSAFTINHLKVPRNDGTNYADYLLNDTPVTSIAVDAANRKWIGTQGSGLFFVNADGSGIIKQFTTSNSDLTSNHILSVACNPNNNSVYVGTTTGVMEYFSDASASAESFSNIYAYPNPVRPEYSGVITITGLMENSLVKIADASGSVLRALQSNGGMATWDGCNANGDKVKSGVYYVLASQHENEKSSGVVTKILIVR